MNWHILIIRGRKAVILPEGPFKTMRDAVAFAQAEVSGQWVVVKIKGAQ